MVIDGVTKQFNRRFLGDYINNAFYEDKQFGVVVVAMDDFKMINKTYGVDVGDNLLLQVWSFLEQLKFGQLVFRFGSDQFCIILQRSKESIAEVAKQIEDRFSHPWYPKGEVSVMMSASICCMECPKDARSFGELVEVVDYSMAVAKKTKKGRVTNADELELDRIQRDKAIEKAVKVAIAREELMVYYQPIFCVGKGVYNSAEALVRLNDEQLGWISPDEFIPIADKMIGLMEQYNVKPEQINIEITETANMSIAVAIEKNIRKLVEYGITLSLDDYGSGNANIGVYHRNVEYFGFVYCCRRCRNKRDDGTFGSFWLSLYAGMVLF